VTRLRPFLDEGFTLIELMVVVLIILILSAIAVPVYIGQQDHVRDETAISDLSLAKLALISWSVDHEGGYTTALADLGPYGYSNSEPVTGTEVSIALSADDFCIEAIAATGNVFSVTEFTSPQSGSCT
jgi:type IV pilus assembly protein PilA